MITNSSDYPQRLLVQGEIYSLKQESNWTRRYTSPSEKFYIVSRLLDKSFDEMNLNLDPQFLTESEKKDAALALLTSGRKDLPSRWERIVEDFRRECISP
jgi:hypothetical protein